MNLYCYYIHASDYFSSTNIISPKQQNKLLFFKCYAACHVNFLYHNFNTKSKIKLHIFWQNGNSHDVL